MIKNNEILFLIRSYNEGDHLIKTIQNIKNEGFNKILVIDDGSTDGTYKKLKNRKDIFYIRHLINCGGGAALETGFEFVRRYYKNIGIKYVITFDADEQHSIKDINNFIKKMGEGDYDIIFGSRFISNNNYKRNIPFLRKLVLIGGRIFTRLFSNISITDPHNGLRMLKISTIKKVKLTMAGFEYASELVDIIANLKLKYSEVPVNITYTTYSLSKGQKSSNAINILIKMIRNKFLK